MLLLLDRVIVLLIMKEVEGRRLILISPSISPTYSLGASRSVSCSVCSYFVTSLRDVSHVVSVIQ